MPVAKIITENSKQKGFAQLFGCCFAATVNKTQGKIQKSTALLGEAETHYSNLQ